MLTSDVDITQTAQAAETFLSDGVVVTGTATGSAVNVAALKGQSNFVVDRIHSCRFHTHESYMLLEIRVHHERVR